MTYIEQKFSDYLKRFANGGTKTRLPAEDFNVRDITVTNLINVDDERLYADVHFLFGYDNGSEMFTTNLGYRFFYQDDETVKTDLVYVAGNTYLFKDFQVITENTIDNSPLYDFQIRNNKDLISVFAWALDTEDVRLLHRCCDENICIKRSGVNGDHYELEGLEKAADFIKQDKTYYKENMYSLVIEKEDVDTILAYHLYPANTGNKHLGSNTRYVQFFNEDITFTIDDLKICKVIFKRKERPIVKRSQILYL